MPQLIALALAGAGLVAGYRWLSRISSEARERLERAQTEARRQSEMASQPRDLGRLEWDEQAQVYRPREPGA